MVVVWTYGWPTAQGFFSLAIHPQVGKIPWRRAWPLLQYSCLENSVDRGAWWATVHGVTKSRTRLSTQRVASGPAAPSSPSNLSEKQTFKPPVQTCRVRTCLLERTPGVSHPHCSWRSTWLSVASINLERTLLYSACLVMLVLAYSSQSWSFRFWLSLSEDIWVQVTQSTVQPIILLALCHLHVAPACLLCSFYLPRSVLNKTGLAMRPWSMLPPSSISLFSLFLFFWLH